MATEKILCKYCGKEFRRESTLLAHQCEPKRRWLQEKETGVQFGLRAYLHFYETMQGSAKNKSYKDFVTSSYYSAFVKFGQYIVQIRAVNPHAYIDWTIKNVKKLDQWTKEIHYETFLYEYLRKEHPNDALDRSFSEMQKWADSVEKPFNTIFAEGGFNKVCNMITNGRISPWIIYNCDSGVEFLSKLSDIQVKLVYKYIDPDFWQQKFKNYVADTEFIKLVLLEAKV